MPQEQWKNEGKGATCQPPLVSSPHLHSPCSQAPASSTLGRESGQDAKIPASNQSTANESVTFKSQSLLQLQISVSITTLAPAPSAPLPQRPSEGAHLGLGFHLAPWGRFAAEAHMG